DLVRAEMHALEEKLAQDRQSLAAAERELIQLDGALAEKSSRLEVLKQLNDEGEGLAEGSQAILKGAGDLAQIQSSLGGALVSQLDVDPTFVPAIEVALGRALNALVLTNADAATRIATT